MAEEIVIGLSHLIFCKLFTIRFETDFFRNGPLMKRTRTILILTFLISGLSTYSLRAQGTGIKPPSSSPTPGVAALQAIAESGQYGDGLYTNTGLSFKVRIPDGWTITGEDLNKRIMDQGRSLLKTNESKPMQKALDRSMDNTRILFVAKSAEGPTVGVLACGVEKLPTRQTRQQYAASNKGFVLKNAGTTLTRDLYLRRVGETTFSGFDIVVTKPTVTLRQTYLITIKNNFAFFFITTSNDDVLQEKMLAAIDTLASSR